jgi:hypothetical protein
VRLRPALLLAILSLMSAATAADIGLSPPRLDLTVPRGATTTETATVFSTADQPMDLAVTTSDWVQSDTGDLSFVSAGGDPYGASHWITLSTDVASVPANGSLEYRFSVSVPGDPAVEGTYKTVVFFTTQPQGAATAGNSLRTRQRLGLVVYVTVAGTAKPALSISDFYSSGKKLFLTLANDGNVVTRLGGAIQLRDQAGTTVASLPIPDRPVQRGGVLTLPFDLPKDLKSGFYVALALVKPDNVPVQAGQLQLTVP